MDAQASIHTDEFWERTSKKVVISPALVMLCIKMHFYKS